MSLCLTINPVTIKELRQMVRSRFIATGLIGYLAVQLIGVSLVLLSSRSESHASVGLYSQALGKGVFHSVFFLLSLLLLLCIPLYVGTRLGLERGNDHLDLQFITALTPRQFVDGKVASAVVLILMFAGGTLPFLVLSYLLRGVDVFRVLWAFCGLLLVSVCCLYGVLFLGAITASRVLRLFLLLFVICVLFSFMVAVNVGGSGILSSGTGPSLSSWQEICGFATVLLLIVALCALVRTCTVAALSPPHSNRSLPVRVWVTSLWLFWGVLCLAFRMVGVLPKGGGTWTRASVLGAVILLAVSASMPCGHSRRVCAEISPRRWARWVQFPFFTGAESGMAWALALGFCTVIATHAVNLFEPRGSLDQGWASSQAMTVFLYLSAYVCSVRAAWLYGLNRWLSPRLVGVIVLMFLALGGILPYLLTLDGHAGGLEPTALFGNVFAVFDKDCRHLPDHLIYAGVWAAIAWTACMPSIFDAFRRFRRPACAVRTAEELK